MHHQKINILSNIKISFILIVFSSFIFVFMEWLFEITKPSMLDILPFISKIKILIFAIFIMITVSLFTLPIIILLNLIVGSKSLTTKKYLFAIPSALLLSLLGLLLFDNFTYTIFHYGIVNSKSWERILYMLGFMFMIFFITKTLGSLNLSKNIQSPIFIMAVMILLGSAFLSSLSFNFKDSFFLENRNYQLNNAPNIILISSDGINAENLSLYGYERETTPFIDELANSSLVSLNSFSNASTSMGSETALLTGKLPITTRVLYSPDILTEKDRFQHLPGLLKHEGYFNVSLGVPYHVDVNEINFHYAFDNVSCVSNSTNIIYNQISEYGYNDEVYFLSTVVNRIIDRVFHIFFIKQMKNPNAAVYDSTYSKLEDQERLSCLYTLLDESFKADQPIFAHIHLMGTHGPTFSLTTQVFSKSEEQSESWMTDFYDDAILNFDQIIENLVTYLQEHSEFNNTLLILYTDHPQRWGEGRRIPLIFHFPEGQYAGTIIENTQTIDVAPTILDYLDIDQPAWMEGNSLLHPIDPYRLIYSFSPIRTELNSAGFWSIPEDSASPPFYQFRKIIIMQCQNLFSINLQSKTFSESGKVPAYAGLCPNKLLFDGTEIYNSVTNLLIINEFNLPNNW